MRGAIEEEERPVEAGSRVCDPRHSNPPSCCATAKRNAIHIPRAHQALERRAAERRRRLCVDVEEQRQRRRVLDGRAPRRRHLDRRHVLGAVVEQGADKVEREARLRELRALLFFLGGGGCQNVAVVVRGPPLVSIFEEGSFKGQAPKNAAAPHALTTPSLHHIRINITPPITQPPPTNTQTHTHTNAPRAAASRRRRCRACTAAPPARP